MAISTLVAGNPVTASALNTNFSSIETTGFDLVLGEDVAASKAVYVKAADGKVYKTDAGQTDERINSYLGFLPTSGSNGNTRRVQCRGILAGFTGLTAGSKYYLAKPDTSQSDFSGGNSNTGVSNDLGGSNDDRVGVYFTSTKRGKLASLVVRIHIVGSPTGNVVCVLYTGTPSGTTDAGTIVSTVTTAAGSISEGLNTFSFSDIILPAGAYYFAINQTVSNASHYFQVRSDGTVSAYVATRRPGNAWNLAGVTNFEFQVNFTEETFAVGDITTWFFDYQRYIGRAISTTQLMLEREYPELISSASYTITGTANGSKSVISTTTIPTEARFAIIKGTATGDSNGGTTSVINFGGNMIDANIGTITIRDSYSTSTAAWIQFVIQWLASTLYIYAQTSHSDINGNTNPNGSGTIYFYR